MAQHTQNTVYLFKSPQLGFSLVGILLSVSLMSIIGLGMASLINGMQLSQNSVKFRLDADNLNEEIRALLGSPTACTNSFGGRVATAGASFNITTLYDGSAAPGVATYNVGEMYGDRSVTLLSMTLAEFVAGSSPNKAQMTLTSTMGTSRKATGAQTIPRTVKLSLDLNAANQITNCIALSKMSDGIWQRSPINTSNIFFTAASPNGKVGIGISNPLTSLNVLTRPAFQGLSMQNTIADGSNKGGFIVGARKTNANVPFAGLGTWDDGSNRVVFLGGQGWSLPDPTSIKFYTASTYNETVGAGIERMVISSNGNIGIGAMGIPATSKLDVAGNASIGAYAGITAAPANSLIVSGRVGIGTATPAFKLDIRETIASTPGILRVRGPGDGAQYSNMILGDNVGYPSGHEWNFSHRMANHNLLFFNWNGSAFTNVLQLQENGGIATGFYANNVQAPADSLIVSGNVGIGTSSPAYKLHVQGTAGLSTGTAWTNASDIRLKDVHGDYEYGLDEVLKLHTVRFSYKKNNALGLPSDRPMTGFIAQEVEKIIPEAVNKNVSGYLELNVDPIHWATVNAVKDLHGEIKTLQLENAQLKQWVCAKDPSAPFCQGRD